MMTEKQPIQYYVDIFYNDFPMGSCLIDIMSHFARRRDIKYKNARGLGLVSSI